MLPKRRASAKGGGGVDEKLKGTARRKAHTICYQMGVYGATNTLAFAFNNRIASLRDVSLLAALYLCVCVCVCANDNRA